MATASDYNLQDGEKCHKCRNAYADFKKDSKGWCTKCWIDKMIRS